jgi:hypothetical protein
MFHRKKNVNIGKLRQYLVSWEFQFPTKYFKIAIQYYGTFYDNILNIFIIHHLYTQHTLNLDGSLTNSKKIHLLLVNLQAHIVHLTSIMGVVVAVIVW